MSKNEILNLKNLKLVHNSRFEGGGIFAKDTFLKLLSNGKKYDTIFEWCSGLGTIGFYLLESGICNKLVLGDISADALKLANETVKINNLESKCQVYQISKLSDLPSNLHFDAVVSNPPHFKNRAQVAPTVTKLNHLEIPGFLLEADDGFRMGVDEGWLAHKDFYSNIHKFCNPDCDVIIWENAHGSSFKDFKEMISNGGLELIDVISDTTSKFTQCYSIHTKLKTSGPL